LVAVVFEIFSRYELCGQKCSEDRLQMRRRIQNNDMDDVTSSGKCKSVIQSVSEGKYDL